MGNLAVPDRVRPLTFIRRVALRGHFSPSHRDDIVLVADDPLNEPGPSLKRMAFLVGQIMHVIGSDDCRCGVSQHCLGHMRRDPQA